MDAVMPEQPLRRVVPQALYLWFLPLWFFAFVGVAMAGANADSDWAGVAVLAVLLYPPVVLVAALASRAARRQGRRSAARVWDLLPMPWVLVGGAFMLYALRAS